jgi:hypothetical protein
MVETAQRQARLMEAIGTHAPFEESAEADSTDRFGVALAQITGRSSR